MEAVVEQAKSNQGMYGKKTILFIDEIHRFNKGQQDYLLPFVEDGTVILIGATTENPYFEVNSALLSSSVIFELHPLATGGNKGTLLNRAVIDQKRGWAPIRPGAGRRTPWTFWRIWQRRRASRLNAMELGVLTTPRSEDGKIRITLDGCLRMYPEA